MTTQRHTKFEYDLVKYFNTVENCLAYKMRSQMSGKYGSRNFCDILVYHWPTLFYFEAKSFAGSRFYFDLRPRDSFTHQLDNLYEKSKITGINCGFIFWAVDYKKTFYVDVRLIKELVERGYKSIAVDDLIAASKEKDSYVLEVESEVVILYPKLINPLQFLREVKWINKGVQ